MKNLYYIKGQIVHHSMWCSPRTDKEVVEYIGVISDYMYNNYDKKGWNEIELEFPVSKQTKEINIHTIHLKVTEHRLANRAEVSLYKKSASAKNLVLETRAIRSKTRFGEKVDKIFSLYYKSKEDFIINLNGKDITFAELKTMTIPDGEKVILSGDNGYSHCWSETFGFGAVFEHIDYIFSEEPSLSFSRSTRASRVYRYGDDCGWNYCDHGELKVRTTKSDIHFSQVSDT